MPTLTQQLRDRGPLPTAAETTMNDHEDRHN